MMSVWNKILFSFPIQLTFIHIKKNLALVFVWIFLITSISGGVGSVYGIHLLFLDPEYINEVGFKSFFIVGIAFGILTMGFHITCYILIGHHFTFVGVLEKPFAKFTLNNSLIPLAALLFYMLSVVLFHADDPEKGWWELCQYILGLLGGTLTITLVTMIYFRFTNKDIFKYLTGSVDKRLRKNVLSRERVMNKLKETRQAKYRVDSYLDLKLKLRQCQHLNDFYDKSSVLKVFDQNHFNSVVLELIVIALVLVLGGLVEYAVFQIPAAASAMLLFAILLMLVGAVSYWFKGWGVAFALAIFLLSNVLTKAGVIKGLHPAGGLDYSSQADYTLESLSHLTKPSIYQSDKEQMLSVLENWKQKQDTPRPKMIFQCVSGGGQRAALWTVNGMQKADSVLGGQLMKQTVLITGASGGMIGAAYYRELYRRKLLGATVDLESTQLLENIGKDNLNVIIFSLLVNDTFFRFRSFDFAGRKYLKDRGYHFEQKLNENLGGILNRSLMDYQNDESKATIPMMILSPTIANDGRKLYISTQPVSFMGLGEPGHSSFGNDKVRGVDFNSLFREQSADSLSFLSALRMSASFPYITPTISLPSSPRIEIMDAGISDNFGVSDALWFLFVFRDWIEENTSGVVILAIRDTKKEAPVAPKSYPSLVDRLSYPIASVYNNMGNMQDINNDDRLEAAVEWIRVPLQTVELEYDSYSIFENSNFSSQAQEASRKEINRASLSWHLTSKEKKSIIQNIDLESNQQALHRLQHLMQ
ncbi:MAG: patatin-like phospholipase family protein [Cyclobacteriaceae bacterium]|nr:patatin-like phospholipase family protein [Cyclobacteriaceae bacterium HetDA_MAG_MS6]